MEGHKVHSSIPFNYEIQIIDGTENKRDSFSFPTAGPSAETPQLHDLCSKLSECFPSAVELGRENAKESSHSSYKLEIHSGASKKSLAFKQIIQKWCWEVCKPGYPFWLTTSSESISSAFHRNRKRQVHRLLSLSFSLGSFYARSVFVEHYNTKSDNNYIKKKGIHTNFEHDVSKLTILLSCCPPDSTKYRVEFEYKQFEDYVLVDLNKDLQTIDLYIPLIRPPIVKKEASDVKNSSFMRCVELLSCSRDVLGNSSVLRLRYAYSNLEDQDPIEVIARLGSQNRTIYFAAVETNPPRDSSEIPRKPDLNDFKAGYALECLLSRGFKVTDRLTSAFYDILQSSLETRDTSQICRALYQLIAYVENDRFCPLESKLQQLLFGTFKPKVEVEFEIPKHYAHVPRIIVTPTQDYLVQPELVAENRVIRQYGHEYAMRVAFRDEDFNKLMSFGDSMKDVLNTRVVDFLKNGIVMCGRHFHFLACSNSQLRDHGAWLFAKHDGVGVEEIRKSLGQFDDIRCVATYVSRMGQCFSSTKESVKVSVPEGVLIKKIPEIEVEYKDVKFQCCGASRSGTYTFSDGIGKISLALAEKVADSLGLKTKPSAYQIRYGGCKGMLAIDIKIPGGKWKDVVCYRKSMKKFQSEHKDLEICEYSKPNFLYLNRQCITLLSGLGVQDEAFIKLQDAMLMRLASMLLSEKVALDMIGQAHIAGGMKASHLRNSGILVTREPFFRSTLLAIYKARLNDLIRKARIAIPQAFGRLMVGVLDETDKLDYGQVFIRYTKDIGGPKEEFITRKGPVMVTKNPCFHPGDMRKLEAFDVQSLHHLVDCIVFPAKGPRPHTDEISGSDLDGDKYFVTWYEPFLKTGKNAEPMDFAAPEKKILDRSVNVNDMIDFIGEYIKNDQLGIIANAHLVHADSEEKGVKSDKCVKLAHMHSDAVDFPKTGKCPSLTPDLRPEQYPDFMMKVDKPRYRSTRVLGKLFQKCKQLERASKFIRKESMIPDFRVDQDLILEGHQKYISSAKEKRDYYNTKLGSLMALYGLKNEGEVLTGCLMKVGSRLSGKTDERFEVAQLIQASVASLRSKIKEDFYEEFGGKEKVDSKYKSKNKYPDNVLLKASAWYAVTYMNTDSIHAEGPGEPSIESRDEWSLSDTPLLSFPWVVARLLAYIKTKVLKKRNDDLIKVSDIKRVEVRRDVSMNTRNQAEKGDKYLKKTSEESEIHDLRDISEVISKQAKTFFFNGSFRKDMMADLEKIQEERGRVYDEICCRSGKRLPPFPILGASLTGLNVGSKQLPSLELYLHTGWKDNEKTQKHHLESLGLYPLQFNGSFTKQKDLKISIQVDPFKMRKTMYVFFHILKRPCLLHLLLVIMHWGRKRHLIGSWNDSFMTVEDLAVLFIGFCESKRLIEKIPDLNEQCKNLLREGVLKATEEKWKNTILEADDHSEEGFLNGTEPGLALVKFLEHYAIDSELDTLQVSKVKSVKNPVNPKQLLFPDLSPKQIQILSDAALHGFHSIAQCRGLDSILKSEEQENKNMQESLTLPKCTWGTIKGAEDFVAYGLSKLTKTEVNIRQDERGSKIIMEVFGNYSTLVKCQEERKNLEKRLKGISVYNSTINGGYRFIFLGQSPTDSNLVTVKEFEKNFTVNLKNKPSLCGHDEKKLLKAINEQLGAFSKRYISYLHSSKKLELSIEYGSVCITAAHAWTSSDVTVECMEEMLTQSFSDSRNYRRKGNLDTNNNNASKVIFTESKINVKLVSKDLHEVLASRSLGEVLPVQSTEYYLLVIKNDKSFDSHLHLVYDKSFKFKQFKFKPFKWLVADLKTHGTPERTSRDIDYRFTMTSKRELEAQEAQEAQGLSIYDVFAKTEILAEVNGQLKISEEFDCERVISVHLINVDVHKLDRWSEIFLEVRKTKEFSVRHFHVFEKQVEFLTFSLRASVLDGRDITDKAKEVTQNLLSASKAIVPFIKKSLSFSYCQLQQISG